MISILMPVYNGLPHLNCALRSLIWQTHTDWELVAIDDGSDDGSLEFLQDAARRDGRIRVFARPHRGVVSALNFGLSQCRSEWVARMDSDDISAPRRLQRQWEFAQKGEAQVIGSFVRIFPRLPRTLGMKRYERWLNRYWRHQDLVRDIFVESPLVHPSVLYERAAVERAGAYRDCPWPEDYDLWLRLWQQGARLAKVPEVLFFWRDDFQRLTHTDGRCSHDALRELKLSALMDVFFPECSSGKGAAQMDEMDAIEQNAIGIARQDGTGSSRQVLVWGAGTNGKDLLKDLRARGLFPVAFVDNNPSRRGQKILDIPVLAPEDVRFNAPTFIIMAVSNPFIRAQVRKQLDDAGWQEGVNYACLANIALRR